jgi:hypothetical protein
MLDKQRPVQEPSEPAIFRLVHGLREPAELRLLLRIAAAEQQCVETDQTPTLDVLEPAVRADMLAPSGEPLGIDWLMAMAGVADVVIARHRPPSPPEVSHQSGAVLQVVRGSGAVDGEIAGVDHEIGPLGRDPFGHRRPVVSEMRFFPTEMGIGNLNESDHLGVTAPNFAFLFGALLCWPDPNMSRRNRRSCDV